MGAVILNKTDVSLVETTTIMFQRTDMTESDKLRKGHRLCCYVCAAPLL